MSGHNVGSQCHIVGTHSRDTMSKTLINAKKAKCYRRTDGQTDGAGCKVACTRLKTKEKQEKRDRGMDG